MKNAKTKRTHMFKVVGSSNTTCVVKEHTSHNTLESAKKSFLRTSAEDIRFPYNENKVERVLIIRLPNDIGRRYNFHSIPNENIEIIETK